MGFKAADLIKLLQDKEVREEIRKICREQPESSYGTAVMPQASAQETSEKNLRIRQLTVEIDHLKESCHSKEQEVSALKDSVNTKDRELSALRMSADTRDRELAAMKAELEETREKANLYDRKYTEAVAEKNLQAFSDRQTISGMEAEIRELRQKNDQYLQLYAAPAKYYKLYQNLSETTRDGLCNVVCDSDVIHFVASLSNADSLKRIWEYAKGLLSDPSCLAETRSLKEIFAYFFDLYNTSLPEPAFRMDDTEPGDEYDDALHAKARGSASSGMIREVLLPGYISVNTGRPICKTVVFV